MPYTREEAKRILTIQSTDVPNTAVVYAVTSPREVTLSPLFGWDSIKPFVDAGRRVTIVGCIPILHPHLCETIRAVVRKWDFSDRLDHIIDCDEMKELLRTLKQEDI